MLRDSKKSGGRQPRGAEKDGLAGTSNRSQELPTLTFNEGRADIQTNIVECEEKWSIFLKKTYGYVGRLLELKKHYVELQT